MLLENNVLINFFSILVLVIVTVHCMEKDYKALLQNRIYLLMLKMTMLMLLFDIFSRFDGKVNALYPVLNQMGNFVVFGLSLSLPTLWLVYVSSQVHKRVERVRKLYAPLAILNLINLLITLLSPFFGFYYTIDADNIYHRGPLFFLPVTMTIILLVVSFVFTMVNSKKIKHDYYYSLLLFALPLLGSILLQILFYGVSLMLNAVSIYLLVVFLNIQNKTILTDYLTGINNRKSLETYLESKISSATPGRTFSAIIIDLDGFKAINDTYGHNEGDNALQTFANLLNSSLRSNDFIARFGGDEFFIVLDTSNQAILEEIVGRIYRSVERFNRSGKKSYPLSFSIGYGIYDYHSHMGRQEFQKHIDKLMYENKQKLKSSPILNGFI